MTDKVTPEELERNWESNLKVRFLYTRPHDDAHRAPLGDASRGACGDSMRPTACCPPYS